MAEQLCQWTSCRKPAVEGASYCQNCARKFDRQEQVKASIRQKEAKRNSCPHYPDRANRETYHHRNRLLLSLGYPDYQSYLASELWQLISREALTLHGNSCCICSGQPVSLHHLSYRLPVLLGEDLSKIVPVCNACHKLIEFDYRGNKRTLLDSQFQFYCMWISRYG